MRAKIRRHLKDLQAIFLWKLSLNWAFGIAAHKSYHKRFLTEVVIQLLSLLLINHNAA